jgi:uncharacterized protein
MLKRSIIKIWLLFFLLISASLSFSAVIPKHPEGYVSDYAKMLTQDQADKITHYLQTLQKTTGDQLVVATFNRLQNQSLEEFSIHLAEQWKIGQSGKDNGVILVVIKQNHQVRFEVGYGLEGTVTDWLAADTIQKIMIPDFKQGKMAEGIYRGVTHIGSVLEGKPAQPEAGKPHSASAKNQLAPKAQKTKGSDGWLTFILLFVAITCYYLAIVYIIISVIGNTILSCLHFFSSSRVTHSNRWFGPHAFFRITLWQVLFFYFIFGGGSRSMKKVFGKGSGVVFGGGGTFGGGGASGAW